MDTPVLGNKNDLNSPKFKDSVSLDYAEVQNVENNKDDHSNEASSKKKDRKKKKRSNSSPCEAAASLKQDKGHLIDLTFKANVRNLISLFVALPFYLSLYRIIYKFSKINHVFSSRSLLWKETWLHVYICTRFCEIIFKWQENKSLTKVKHVARILVFIIFTAQCCSTSELDDYTDINYLAIHQSRKKYILVRYVCSFVLYLVIHDFLTQYDTGNLRLHLLHSLTEIIDFYIMFWEDRRCILGHTSIIYNPDDCQIEMNSFVALLIFYNWIIILLAVMHGFNPSNKRLPPEPSEAVFTIKKLNEVIADLFHRRNSDDLYDRLGDGFGFFFTILILDMFEIDDNQELELKIDQNHTTKYRGFQDLKAFYVALPILFCVWLFKNFVLSNRKASSVYKRFRSRILQISEQIYFLGILDQRQQNIFNLPRVIGAEQTTDEWTNFRKLSLWGQIMRLVVLPIDVLSDFGQTSSLQSFRGSKYKIWLKMFKREQIRNDLVIWKQHCDSKDLAVIQTVARYISEAKYSLSSTEDYMSSIFTLLDSTCHNSNIREPLQQLITWENKYEEDWNYFVQEQLKINDVNSVDSPIYLQDFKAWVVKARNDVTLVANTLSGAKDVANCLKILINMVIIAIFGAIVVTLLGLYEYVKTLKFFAFNASTFFCASFLIKDTLKDLFERTFFVYAIHPFEIGDVCIIQDRKMEVTAMGIWTTTFSVMDRIGLKEDIIYPNSMLAKLKITKLESEFNWNDSIEFELDSTDKIDISKLKQEIKGEHLANFEKLHFDPSSHNLSMSRGQKIKLITNLRYIVGEYKDWSYFECQRRKDELAAEIYLFTQNIIAKYSNT